MERKLATVLFVDLVDSTALVSASDPEVVRRRVMRFFDEASRCITRHGGTVEKFAGDAVMAAFGIPVAHEDDAERAVRSALGILESTRELGVEARLGVEAGEVVVDEGDSTFATGEAVNLAARLQQAAAPGEILIGPAAHRLTLGRIEAENVGALELRGVNQPIPAWRALAVSDGWRRGFNVAAPLVGREAELELLTNTFERALRARRTHLFTIYGEPGVGKSRLAREFTDALEGVTILAGRCLPYGEGITYWPLAEMVKAAAGISDDDPLDEAITKLRITCEDEAVADLLGLASGVLEAVQGQRSQQEIAWAVREWAERLAQDQPLVLVFEDIHWAEDPLLDLIEHLADWVREVPLLIVCLARPELLDVRPGWGGGRVRATAIELEPLAPAESDELVEALLPRDAEPLPPEMRRTVLEKTEGNPLFVEETVRMLMEYGTRDGVAERIPDTLQALIAARIDRLPGEEKLVLQRASVIGRVFWGGAIAHLSPELDELEQALDDLLLREFVLREPRSTISGETAYRFKHVLIREVAYASLTKSARADHHARFAEWLRERAGEELLEIRAYHLDQACSLLAELDGTPPAALAEEAAAALEAAGRRAFAREANRSARKLLLRAVELGPTLKRRYLAAKAAWRLDEFPAVSAEMEKVRAAAYEAGERGIEGSALLALAEVAALQEANPARAQELAQCALEVLDDDDQEARFSALSVLATVAWTLGDLGGYERYSREGLEIARETGRKDLESYAAQSLASAHLARLEVEEAKPFVEQAIALAEDSGSVVARGVALRFCGILHLQRGELEEAETALEQARGLLTEAGAAWSLARTLNYLAWAVWLRGAQGRAERLFRDSIRILKPIRDRATLCESQRGLAQLLVERGKLDEAEALALEARETVGPQDVSSRLTTTMALGVVRAAQGRDSEAEDLLTSALRDARGTDQRRIELEVLKALVRFLRERDRGDEAADLEARLEELAPFALRSTAA